MRTLEDGWGDMVMPGVYMISRSNTTISNSLQSLSNNDGTTDFEQLHKDIEKLQFDIEQLTRSNKEIQDYINDTGSDKDKPSYPDHEPKCTCPEDDVDIFIEALKENDQIIKKKQRELDHLKETINGLHCGCVHHALIAKQRPQCVERATPTDRIIL